MKRFLFSLAIMLTGALSAQAQSSDFCIPMCEVQKSLMLSQCAQSNYPAIVLSYYDYFTDGQEFPPPPADTMGMSQCELEAELAYRLCIGECTGYYPD